MLTITEAVNEIKEAKKLIVKGKILATFYKDILEMSQDCQVTKGEIAVGFDKREDFDLAKDLVQELKDNNYRFRQYVHSVDVSLDDLEIIIHYDLEHNSSQENIIHNFTADDIPF